MQNVGCGLIIAGAMSLAFSGATGSLASLFASVSILAFGFGFWVATRG